MSKLLRSTGHHLEKRGRALGIVEKNCGRRSEAGWDVYLSFAHLVVPMGIFWLKTWVGFPKESHLQPSLATLTLMNYTMHAGSFRVSIIRRTLTWTTGSLMCVRGRSCTCVYTQGLGIPTASQHISDSEKLTIFSCAPDAIRTAWIWSPMLYQLSHPVTPCLNNNG